MDLALSPAPVRVALRPLETVVMRRVGHASVGDETFCAPRLGSRGWGGLEGGRKQKPAGQPPIAQEGVASSSTGPVMLGPPDLNEVLAVGWCCGFQLQPLRSGLANPLILYHPRCPGCAATTPPT